MYVSGAAYRVRDAERKVWNGRVAGELSRLRLQGDRSERDAVGRPARLLSASCRSNGGYAAENAGRGARARSRWNSGRATEFANCARISVTIGSKWPLMTNTGSPIMEINQWLMNKGLKL